MVNEVSGVELAVNLIPHALQATNLRHIRPGDRVNLEADTLTRYAARLSMASK
jgi:riboflavin synthase